MSTGSLDSQHNLPPPPASDDLRLLAVLVYLLYRPEDLSLLTVRSLLVMQ